MTQEENIFLAKRNIVDSMLSVSIENKIEFGTKLIEYYENETKLYDLKNFLLDKCLEVKK